jgi:acyl carrier protein
VTLVRVANERHELMWTTHHLCIDGWSWPVVFSELSSCYEGLRKEKAQELAPPCPYSRFIRWLATDAPASESFWKTELRGFKEPTPIDLSDPAPHSAAVAELGDDSASVTADAHDRLQALARRLQVTPSCVVQAAWAMTLGHYSAASDVVFGAAYSGRPPEIPGVEGLVGPCVNNVPVRVSLAPGQSVATLLAALQRKQADLMHHQHTPLAQIQEWAGVPLRLRLFESLLVFQNYAVGADARRFGDAEVRLMRGPDATGYPVTLIAIPGPGELRLKLLYQKNRIASDQGKTMLADLLTVLAAMSASTEQTTDALLAQLPGSTRGRAAQVAANRRHARTSAYVAPSGDTERALAAIWSELFEVERVGLDDNFFDLGGNSLLLVRAHQELQKRFGADLPITALFQYPTVRSLARHLSGGGAEAGSDELRERSRKRKEALARIRGVAAKR